MFKYSKLGPKVLKWYFRSLQPCWEGRIVKNKLKFWETGRVRPHKGLCVRTLLRVLKRVRTHRCQFFTRICALAWPVPAPPTDQTPPPKLVRPHRLKFFLGYVCAQAVLALRIEHTSLPVRAHRCVHPHRLKYLQGVCPHEGVRPHISVIMKFCNFAEFHIFNTNFEGS